MVLLWNPLRFFAPLGGALAGAGLIKLVYDLATKNLRVATNTVVLLMSAAAVILVALMADMLVQINRPRDMALPASSPLGPADPPDPASEGRPAG